MTALKTNKNIKYQVRVTNVFTGKFGGDGIVTGMRYKKVQGGYKQALIRLKIDAGKYSYRMPKRGEFLEVEGRWSSYKDTYQLIVSWCCPTPVPDEIIKDELIKNPTELPAVLKYFFKNHPSFKGIGVGPRRIQKAIDSIGSFKQFMADLSTGNVPSLTDAFNNTQRAEKFITAYKKHENEIETSEFLNSSGLDIFDIKKVTSLLGTDCKKVIIQNPYVLLAFGGRLAKKGWNLAENFRNDEKYGFSVNDDKRFLGAVDKMVYDHLGDGHTAIVIEDARQYLSQLLGSPQYASEALQLALNSRTICSMNGKVQGVGPAQLEIKLEQSIVNLIKKSQLSLFGDYEINNAISQYQSNFFKQFSKKLVGKQLDAIKVAFDENIAVIQGEGGTGKTTSLAGIKFVGNVIDRPVYFVALAGIAQRKIYHELHNQSLIRKIEIGSGDSAREEDEPTCFTIHSFINSIKKSLTNIKKNEPSPFDIKINQRPIIVMDESSMPDLSLFSRLFAHLDNFEFNLVMAGDVGQLAPVGFGVVWHKLCFSRHVRVIELDQVHRQADDNPLRVAASRIRDGILPEIPCFSYALPVDTSGVFFRHCSNRDIVEEAYYLAEHFGLDDTQIVAPTKNLSNKINIQFQQKRVTDDTLDEHYHRKFYPNDRVICTRNNHELGLQNGDLGTFIDVEYDEEVPQVKFDFFNRNYQLLEEDVYLCRIKLGWCITIHKTQGSEFKNTVVVLPKLTAKNTDNIINFIERSLIYTALTRSKNTTVFVGSIETLERAIQLLPRWQTIQTLFDIDKYFNGNFEAID